MPVKRGNASQSFEVSVACIYKGPVPKRFKKLQETTYGKSIFQTLFEEDS